MKTALLTTVTAIVVTLVPVAAQAQLLGGALGGGMNLPTGSIGSMGDLGIERTGRSVTATGNASAAASQTVRAPRVRDAKVPTASTAATGAVASRTASASLDATASATRNAVGAAGSAQLDSTIRRPALVTPAVPALAVPTVAVPSVTNVQLAVPAVPDVAVRSEVLAASGVVAVPVAQVPAYIDSQVVIYETELRGTGAKVRKEGNQIVIDMPADVTFAFDKSDIQPRFRAALDGVSRTLNKYAASYIDVYGHTDSIGSYAYNQALSERRADSVAGYLEGRGVLGGRMHTEGFGKTEPKASNATIEGRAANRRVELVITPYAA